MIQSRARASQASGTSSKRRSTIAGHAGGATAWYIVTRCSFHVPLPRCAMALGVYRYSCILAPAAADSAASLPPLLFVSTRRSSAAFLRNSLSLHLKWSSVFLRVFYIQQEQQTHFAWNLHISCSSAVFALFYNSYHPSSSFISMLLFKVSVATKFWWFWAFFRFP